ncbi:MAG: hypothetical protein E7H31_13715 [Clostridium perfringens]|nr:hypothetical protein [Clostridium perfringens]
MKITFEDVLSEVNISKQDILDLKLNYVMLKREKSFQLFLN